MLPGLLVGLNIVLAFGAIMLILLAQSPLARALPVRSR